MKELQMGPVSISGDIMRIDSETGAICTNKKHWKKWGAAELKTLAGEWAVSTNREPYIPFVNAFLDWLAAFKRSEHE